MQLGVHGSIHAPQACRHNFMLAILLMSPCTPCPLTALFTGLSQVSRFLSNYCTT